MKQLPVSSKHLSASQQTPKKAMLDNGAVPLSEMLSSPELLNYLQILRSDNAKVKESYRTFRVSILQLVNNLKQSMVQLNTMLFLRGMKEIQTQRIA